MFDWFKNWYNKAFLDNEDKRVQKQEMEQRNKMVKAKIAYRYPDEDRLDSNVYKRSSSMFVENKEYYTPRPQRNRPLKTELENEELEKKEAVKEDLKEFKPTRFQRTDVPSPVYGFQHNRELIEKEMDETPAFLRKREQQATVLSEQKEEVYDESPRTEDTKKENVIPFTPHKRREKRNRSHSVESKSALEQNVHKRETKPLIKEEKKQQPIISSKEAKEESVPFNVVMTKEDKEKIKETSHDYKMPPLHLLDDLPAQKDQNEYWIEEQMRRLSKTLSEFNVRAKVSRAIKGPTVTRFEVQPDIGVKVSKITNLTDDIKLNLAAKDIRMEAPIPGKNAIGIEVPNQTRRPVSMLEIIKTNAFREHPSNLAVGLGLDIEGNPIILDLKKMPHGLIAGATGSGKSVSINTILVSLLFKASPDDVKFLLIDPKMVELTPYNKLPHLVAPVITDVKAATASLKWAVNEMEERYEKFAQEGARDIERYNQKVESHMIKGEKLPYIVIVIDELADLMMVAPHDVEDAICRIAQKARACGIHLLVATQRPSVDVITGLIKSNIPTRIAFSVSSQVDSRTIIDAVGAEKLLGKGDMLLLENGAGKVKRIQGAFLSDAEIERVTSFVKKHGEPNYLFEQDDLMQQVSFEEEEDDLFFDALQLVVQEGKASTSFLQRKFSIGYNRAARLVDRMEEIGVISKQNGSKPREILMSKEEIRNMLE